MIAVDFKKVHDLKGTFTLYNYDCNFFMARNGLSSVHTVHIRQYNQPQYSPWETKTDRSHKSYSVNGPLPFRTEMVKYRVA